MIWVTYSEESPVSGRRRIHSLPVKCARDEKGSKEFGDFPKSLKHHAVGHACRAGLSPSGEPRSRTHLMPKPLGQSNTLSGACNSRSPAIQWKLVWSPGCGDPAKCGSASGTYLCGGMLPSSTFPPARSGPTNFLPWLSACHRHRSTTDLISSWSTQSTRET